MSRKQSDDLIEFRLGALLGLDEGAPVSADQLDEALAVARAKSPAELTPRESDLLADAELFKRFVTDGLRIESERRQFQASDQRVRRTIGFIDDEPEKRSNVRWMSTAAVGIAAAILLLVMLPKKEALVPGVSEIPLSPPPLVRGASPDLWKDVATAWEAGAFSDAVDRLAAAAGEDSDDSALLYHLGLARLRAGQDLLAVEALQLANELESDPPSDEIRWLLAAALDAAGDRREACRILRQLGTGFGRRAKEATDRADVHCD